MDVVVTTKNVEVPPEVRQYMEKKLQRIARHLPAVSEAQIQVAQEATRSQMHRTVVQATINCKGTLLRGEERGPNVQEAFDVVVDVLDRQAQRHKSRLYRSEQTRRGRRGATIRETEAPVADFADEEEPFELGSVVRTKRFFLKPMNVEEAITQMDLLGHTFFLFLNNDTGEVNLLYSRRDGAYGIIEAGVE